MTAATETRPLVADPAVIEHFIADTIRDDIHLVAIWPAKYAKDPSAAATGKWFGTDATAAATWAANENAKGRGVYWTANITTVGLNQKPEKPHIRAARLSHDDVDPPKDGPFDRPAALARLRSASVPPSFIIDSGNGYQACWMFDEPVEDWGPIEEINRQAIAAFGGDNCWNIDRLLRLPGSINWPNYLKTKRGCVPVMASIVDEYDGVICTPEQLSASMPPAPPRTASEREDVDLGDIGPVTIENLGITTLSRLFAMITAPANIDRSADTFAVAAEMIRQGFSDAQIAGILLNPSYPISDHCLDQPDPLRAARRAIGGARVKVGKEPKVKAPASTEPGNDPRPHQITIRAGEMHLMATQAEGALIAAEAPLYVRGGIVRPIVDALPASHGRKTRSARLVSVTDDMMLDHLSRSVSWVKWDARRKKLVAADPPRAVASTLLSRDGEWRLPSLAGVITTPTLRPDGTILSTPGYDAETRLLLLDPPVMPAMADRPSRADAEAALALLGGLLVNFPFVDQASRSVALSALITPVVRGAMSVVPMHGVTAHVAGSGKSYVVDLASGIQGGERAPVIAAGRTEEETEKRLGAALLGGQPIISIDNVNGRLGGDALCQLIERPTVSVRPLGASRLVKIESRSTTFATGNNLQLVGDMTRRAILCSLDPQIERPELRQFEFDPFAMIVADRGKYVAAALTIVRAYVVAGYPGELPALASFDGWSRFVRSALVWLGCADPLDTMLVARAEDPELTTLSNVIHNWASAMDHQARSAGQAKAVAERRDGLSNTIHPDFNSALMEVAEGRSGAVDATRLGVYLGRVQGRIVDGLRFSSINDGHSKQKLWKVEHV